MKRHGGKARDGFPAVFETRASARRASGAAATGCVCRQINSRQLMGIGASRELPNVFALPEMSGCIRRAAADEGGRMRGRGLGKYTNTVKTRHFTVSEGSIMTDEALLYNRHVLLSSRPYDTAAACGDPRAAPHLSSQSREQQLLKITVC